LNFYQQGKTWLNNSVTNPTTYYQDFVSLAFSANGQDLAGVVNNYIGNSNDVWTATTKNINIFESYKKLAVVLYIISLSIVLILIFNYKNKIYNKNL